MSGNQDQSEYWNGPAGQRWVEAQESLDRTLASIANAFLAFAVVKPGERVLDIGCGCGTTTLAFAAAAGSGGRLTGLDISAPMLGPQRTRGARPASPIPAADAARPS